MSESNTTAILEVRLPNEQVAILNLVAEMLPALQDTLNEAMKLIRDCKTITETKPEKVIETPKVEAVIEAEPVQADLPEEIAPIEIPSIDDIKTAVITVANRGRKTAAKAIVMQYASSVSSIPEDKRAEVLAKIKELM